MAFLEPERSNFADIIARSGLALVSPVQVWEASVSIQARLPGDGMTYIDQMRARLPIEVAPIGEIEAGLAFDAWRRFGKGRHAAALNLGDCFAYALAKSRDLPLLFKGDDFALTDVRSAA